MKISGRQFWRLLGLSIFFYISTFSSLFSLYVPTGITYILPVVSLSFLAMSGGFKVKKYLPVYYIPWFFFCVFIITGSAMLKFDYLAQSLTRFVCIIMGLILMRDIKWLPMMRRMLLLFTGVYVTFTWFFFFFPKTYSIMIDLYGFIPAGATSWQNGYRVGLADHYSQNGIYITVCFILLTIYFMVKQKNLKRRSLHMVLHLLAIAFTFGALLLTTKRGVLMWGTAAVVLTYLIANPKKVSAAIKLFFISLSGIFLVYIAIENIPELGEVFQRFTTLGTDYSGMERIMMWELAWQLFLGSPILGCGFWSYQRHYASSLFGIVAKDRRYQLAHAHSVYFQVLAETGIVGFVIYIAAVSLLLYDTIKLVRQLRNHPDLEIRFAVFFALAVQIFYLLYSLAGNCLYDVVFYFYAVGMAMTTALKYYYLRNYIPQHAKKRVAV